MLNVFMLSVFMLSVMPLYPSLILASKVGAHPWSRNRLGKLLAVTDELTSIQLNYDTKFLKAESGSVFTKLS
jgi:hypothetical protein